MKHSITFRLFAALLVLSMLMLTACQGVQPAVEAPIVNNDNVANQLGQGTVENLQNTDAPNADYNEGVVLVKSDKPLTDNMLAQLDFVSAEPIYAGSSWYSVKLGDSKNTQEAVEYLRQLDCFDAVDYDYVMKADMDVPSVSHNPHHGDEKHHDIHKIPEGWQHMADKDIQPGGSSDVIVAVIDTGVDYGHLDLRDNIWINTAEIPDNGIDDDANGYVDDVRGWNCVGHNNDPMDDNGHGTHVAGIIAAQNNDIGGVGIAYNCKIMVLKAGNSSGYFNNSDIAEAIQYAYMNGASVINMSFGGGMISVAVEDALMNAYHACVLVAAAGNDGKCNNIGCEIHPDAQVMYPAALPYVIGVMSTDPSGTQISSFSNFDHKPHDAIEYEVYAVGEAVPSCWPGNKYATLQGTSMAAPSVSAIAALLRSYYTDRDMYSSKFIQSQIVNTGTVNPYNFLLKDSDGDHSVANAYEAMTRIPKPSVNLLDYYIDDSVAISEKNNGNGVIDSGETIRLYVSLMNRGGVASNVNVTIDALRNGEFVDPYFKFTNASVTLSDIGTYSIREAYENEYFQIEVSPDCPNDYLTDFNIRFTYTNGLDADDHATYSGDGVARFNVSRGYHLPATITEDTVFTADRLYIIGENLMIPEGITVTFEEGCQIQFYDDREYYNSPAVTVYGKLYLNGTAENMISVMPNERHTTFGCIFYVKGSGELYIEYADTMNLLVADETINGWNESTISQIKHSNIRIGDRTDYRICIYQNGKAEPYGTDFRVDSISMCQMEIKRWNSFYYISSIRDSYIQIISNNYMYSSVLKECVNNVLTFEYSDTHTQAPERLRFSENCLVENNCFLSVCDKLIQMKPIDFGTNSTIINNTFSADYQQYASQLITGYYDATGNPTVDVFGSCSDISALWPHVVSMELFDKNGNPITRVGKEEIKVRVTFNRPMDTAQPTSVSFGTILPYADYMINGSFVSDTVWEGTYTLRAQIENGQNWLKVNNAVAADNAFMKVFGLYHMHEFTIDTTAAMSMDLRANATNEGIVLDWVQDDYNTLMGYNIYRSTDKDGNYVRINPSVLPASDNTFVDDNTEPGVTYWYTFTVVLSDFSESAPAGKVMATAIDTVKPTVYHTPVNQGYMNNNLVISCTASDNVAVSSVVLYYRAIGASEWKNIAMAKQNDKYSATVFGSELTLSGIEYYIVAYDAHNSISKGSAEDPYTVVIKDESALSRLGDVDGDGAITTKDALMIMQTINGDLILADDAFQRADLNKDGVLSSSEALRILQYVNGNVATLEM